MLISAHWAEISVQQGAGHYCSIAMNLDEKFIKDHKFRFQEVEKFLKMAEPDPEQKSSTKFIKIGV